MIWNERINKELKSILSQFQDSYRMICDSSRDEYMKTLPVGAQIPREGVIYGNDKGAEFESMCAGYRERARKIFDEVMDELKEKATEAPSTEAVNSITLLNMRKNLTRDDVDDLLERYGDNLQAWDAIRSIAKDNDIVILEGHPLREQTRKVGDLARTINNTLTVTKANNGKASNAFISLVGSYIDDAFPVEE